nr:iron-containing alcohol dehydrogenase [Desulfobacterales bacterium]
MKKILTHQGPQKIIFGDGAIRLLGQEIGLLERRYAFVVADRGIKEIGLLEGMLESLEEKGIRYIVFAEITPEPSPQLADQGAHMARKEGCDIVVGIGGGSSLDVAKAIAILITNGGMAEDYIGLELVPRPGLPTVMIPTTAGTGSEATFTAVFTMREKKSKGGINSRFMYSNLALLDPELTLSLPPAITATTGMDALTHAVEAFTSLQANPLSDLMAREAISLIGKFLPLATHNGENREARNKMLMGSLLGGLALASAGVGACHALAYSLGALFDVPHGLANAVLLPHVMRFNMDAALEKYAEISRLMNIVEMEESVDRAAQTAVDAISSLSRKIGIPRSLGELNIPESAIDDLAEASLTVKRPIENNPRNIDKEGAVAILREAF